MLGLRRKAGRDTMDKYEFNIKVEQIKKLVTKGDFTTSMKIADTIDWRRVRNANLLAMISQVYEKNGEYQEAKEILMQAYERAPVGKRLLFKLAELALREGNVREAEEYYREFNEAAPGDPRQNLLRYLILKAKGASSRQLAAALEKYVATELDERWMYELAELYAAIGERNLCVQMCDKIALMFAFGKYVDKALALKAQFAALSDYQQDLVQNPDKYEAQYKAVEQEFENGALDVFGEDEQDPEENFSGEMLFPDHDYEGDSKYGQNTDEPDYDGEYDQGYDGQDGYGPEDGDMPYEESGDEVVAEEPMEEAAEDPLRMPGRVTLDEELVANLHQAAAEEQLAREMSRLTRDGIADEDILNEQTKKLYDIHRALPPALRGEEEPDSDMDGEQEGFGEYPDIEEGNETAAAESADEESGAQEMDAEPAGGEAADADETAEVLAAAEEEPVPEYMAIETKTPEKGMEKAIEKLKAYHTQNDSHNQTVRITGSKLSSRGVDAISEQLSGRDLIVDEAGDLVGEELEKLVELMTEDNNRDHMAVVLLDNPRQMEDLYQKYPEQMDKFTRIDGEWVPEEVSIGNAVMEQIEEEERQARKEEDAENAAEASGAEQSAAAEAEGADAAETAETEGTDAAETAETAETDAAGEAAQPEQRGDDYRQEMDVDSFAQYACDYAASIDCSITGKSMLALYERVELMEEDGVPLTKENAEAMIEEAADKAEKPSLGRLITGVFSAKYNKEGLLILREEHFI